MTANKKIADEIASQMDLIQAKFGNDAGKADLLDSFVQGVTAVHESIQQTMPSEQYLRNALDSLYWARKYLTEAADYLRSGGK